MKAIVCRAYGAFEALRVEEVETPVPAEDEVLIRVRAASANPMDVHLMRGRPLIFRLFMGLSRPKIDRAGVDVAGEVEAVGAKVTGLRPGDAVFGAARGAFAEFVCTREGRVAHKPASLSFEEAAALPIAGVTALQALRGRIAPGDEVLIVGAGGGIGSFAVQLARLYGARVDAVCGARHADFVRALGAERVIDYREKDFTRSGGRYDLIFDLAGTRGFSSLRRILAPAGVVVLGGIAGGKASLAWMLACAARCLGGFLRARFSSQRLVIVSAKLHKEDLEALARLAADGKVKPAITARYPLAEAGAALAIVAAGHAEGKVVILT